MIYLDMDGVLADFDKAAFSRLGMTLKRYEKKHGKHSSWAALAPVAQFYASFEPMPDAKVLWEGVQAYGGLPTVLTALPSSETEAVASAKRDWIALVFGPQAKVITCFKREKVNYCQRGDVLIDDRPEGVKYEWASRGGIFITHRNAQESLQKLEWWLRPR